MGFAQIRTFVLRYERHLSVGAMAAGFILDSRALHRVDLPFESLLLYFYFASAGLIILGIHLAEEGKWGGRFANALRPYLPIAFQFIAGSWMSAYLVFYSRSASLGASWPFLLVVFAVFAGTEIFKKQSDKLVFQNGIYFFAVFSFFVFTVPLWLGAIGTWVFLLSGVVALAVFGLFFGVLFATGPKRFLQTGKRIAVATGAIYIVMNALYFTHLIPPLPLTLMDIGIYHSLSHTAGAYRVTEEAHPLLDSVFGTTKEHIVEGDTLYVFTAVFTPVSIRTDVVHRWEYFDAAQNAWVRKSLVSFPVSGGRDGGYRGYSFIRNPAEGRWRVSAETPGGALIGRIGFTVVYVEGEPALQNAIL